MPRDKDGCCLFSAADKSGRQERRTGSWKTATPRNCPGHIRSFWYPAIAAVLAICFGPAARLQAGQARPAGPPYDLAGVRHMEGFAGGPKAKEILSRQGFVVTESNFRQIFEPYLPAARRSMPAFITLDSAWHTYHVLLEDGLQQVELDQARLMRQFSERLYRTASGRKGRSEAVYRDLALFAAVAWAIQDPGCLENALAAERGEVDRVLQAIRSGGQALFFELPLEPGRFRPAGFYARTPELSQYFVARRWYATSSFRLKSEAETLRALYLAMLVESDSELKRIHDRLARPQHAMVGPADDPGVEQYWQIAVRLAGGLPNEEKLRQIISEFRREADRLPGPRINDQFLLPNQFAARKAETKGMRLFGPSQLPSAILFQETTEPAVPGRILPAGVDVFAGRPLASEAGRRALKATEAPAAHQAICRADCGPLPESLHGRALKLLRLIQEPLPKAAPAPLRTAAWQDKQLWTALGGWAEERHTWVLHAKQTGAPGCMFEESPGYVSPYPEFYRQLGQLARQAAQTLGQIAVEPDYAAVGRLWFKTRNISEDEPENQAQPGEMSFEEMEAQTAEVCETNDRTAYAVREYFRAVGKQPEAASVLDRARAWKELDAAAERCAAGKGVTERDRRCMGAFLRSSQGTAAELLPEFAGLCDQLAEIAEKELAGQKLESREVRLIKDYGTTLARFHFYEGDTWLDPRDDLPCISPVFDNPLRDKTLYVGVGRPEAIYVILPVGTRLVLHRGAVLSYREFARPLGQGPNDEQWRQEARLPSAPQPPAWTASFRSTTSPEEKKNVAKARAAEVKDVLGVEIVSHEFTLARIERLLNKWQALKATLPQLPDDQEQAEQKTAWQEEQAREKDQQYCSQLLYETMLGAVDEDVPDLLDRLLPAVPEDELYLLSQGMERLKWEPHKDKLTALVRDPRPAISTWAAKVIAARPETIEVAGLAAEYDKQPPHVRGQYCFLMGSAAKAGPERMPVLAAALGDSSPEVRRLAAGAVAQCRANTAEITAAVKTGLAEPEPAVAAAMVKAATALGLKETAPAMLVRLKKQIERITRSDDDLSLRQRTVDEGNTDLTAALISALGEFKHAPAEEAFRAFVFPSAPVLGEYQFSSPAFEALMALQHKKTLQLLAEIFRDARCSKSLLQTAIVEATETRDIRYIETMLPLFEDIGRNQGVGVWASWHITGILEKACQHDPKAVRLFNQIREVLLKQTRGAAAGDALEALKYFDPAAAARESLVVALDRTMAEACRSRAINILRESPKPWPIRQLLPILDERPQGEYTTLSAGYEAAGTIGQFCSKLDPNNAEDAETLRLVRAKFDEMLKRSQAEAETAIAGLMEMDPDPKELMLRLAGDRSLPYAARTHALWMICWAPEDASRLIPLLSDETKPNDGQGPTIAVCAANAIARILEKQQWDGQESPADYVKRAKGWAEAVER